MGVDAVGKSIGEACFRKETAKKLFGWNDAHIITCEDAARILTEKSAGLKGVNGRKTVFLINKADNDNEMEKAMEIGKYINRFCEYMKITNYKVSITSYKSGREFADFAFLEDWR